MAVFSITGGSNGGTYAKNFTGRLTVYEIEGSCNIANNTSDVYYKLELVSGSAGRFIDYYGYFDVYINGVLVVDAEGYKTINSYNTAITLGEGTINVPHNPDGTKTISCSATIDMASGSSSPGDFSLSGTIELTRIPRTSSVSCNSFNIGDATTITISRASDNFRHSVGWSFGTASGIIADKTSETVIGTTLPVSELYKQIPSARFGIGTIWCDTFYNDEHIGSSSCEFTAYAKESDCKPTVSVSVVDINDTTLKLTGDSQKLIKGFSKAQVSINAEPKNSASITGAYIATGDGRISYILSDSFANIGSNNFYGQATDSRGYSTGMDLQKTEDNWIDYVYLAFTKIEIKRTESTADTVNLILQGNYYNSSFGNADNSLALKYRYKESGGTYSSWTTITPTISRNTFSYTKLFDNLDHNKEYIFEFTASDELMTANSGEVVLTQGIPVIRVGKDYIKINGHKAMCSDICVLHSWNQMFVNIGTEWVVHKVPLDTASILGKLFTFDSVNKRVYVNKSGYIDVEINFNVYVADYLYNVDYSLVLMKNGIGWNDASYEYVKNEEFYKKMQGSLKHIQVNAGDYFELGIVCGGKGTVRTFEGYRTSMTLMYRGLL